MIEDDEKNESKEKRYKRRHDVKTWGFDANLLERTELSELVLKTGLSRKEAVLAALRKFLENLQKDENNAV